MLKVAEKQLHNTLTSLALPVLKKRNCFTTFPKWNLVSDIVVSQYAKFDASKWLLSSPHWHAKYPQ